MISRRDSSDLAQLAHPPRTQVCLQLRLELLLHLAGAGLGRAAPLGDPHQSRPCVGGIGHPLDVAGLLELVDQEPGRLLGHLRGSASWVSRLPPSSIRAAIRPWAIVAVEAVLGQVRHDAGLRVTVDDEHEQRGGQLHGHLALTALDSEADHIVRLSDYRGAQAMDKATSGSTSTPSDAPWPRRWPVWTPISGSSRPCARAGRSRTSPPTSSSTRRSAGRRCRRWSPATSGTATTR